MLRTRHKEADEFYATVIPRSLHADAANVMRQALAGMLWSKQFYYYDVDKWLEERLRSLQAVEQGRLAQRPLAPHVQRRHHLHAGQVGVSLVRGLGPGLPRARPDARGRRFRQAATAIDAPRALHAPQRPDAGLRVELRRRQSAGPCLVHHLHLPPGKGAKREGDIKWLKSCFQKLLLNFTWWVNRKDRSGRNVFEGGFLGLDNIGVFDRSAPLPTGGYLEQADGTAWMALYADNMLEIAMELAMTDDDYADMVLKFLQHDTMITSSLVKLGGGIGMWDEEDGFFYDVLRLPDGQAQRLKVRSMVGLLPLCAATVFEPQVFAKYPEIARRFERFMEARPELRSCFSRPDQGRLRRPPPLCGPGRNQAPPRAGEGARRK